MSTAPPDLFVRLTLWTSLELYFVALHCTAPRQNQRVGLHRGSLQLCQCQQRLRFASSSPQSSSDFAVNHVTCHCQLRLYAVELGSWNYKQASNAHCTMQREIDQSVIQQFKIRKRRLIGENLSLYLDSPIAIPARPVQSTVYSCLVYFLCYLLSPCSRIVQSRGRVQKKSTGSW